MLIPALKEISEIVSLAVKQYPSEFDKAQNYAFKNLHELSLEDGYELLANEFYLQTAEQYIESRLNYELLNS